MRSYIITGAPGAGKTEVIEELSRRGFIGLEEIPRKLLQDKTAEKLGISPFKDLKKFADIVFEKMYEQYIDTRKRFLKSSNEAQRSDSIYIKADGKECSNHLQKETVCFFDRGIPDVFAYLENSNIPIPEEYYTKLNNCNFEKKVFICSPWPEIYTSDSIRPYPFEDTLKLHSQIASIYKKLGFNLVEIPKLPVVQRADFILSSI